MSNRISILDWMDDILKEYLEYERYAEAVDPQFIKLYQLLAKWNNNIYPQDADEDGIKRFEELLNIIPNPNETLEERRYRILVKLNTKLPYTEIQLRRLLGGVLGYDGFKLTVKDLILTISLAEGNNNKLQILLDLLGEIVPMNILIVIHQLVKKHLGFYYGGCVKVGNSVRIKPYMPGEVKEQAIIRTSGYVKVGKRIRIKPKSES